ncbi:hypothetical protein [Mesorhizobium sp. M0244]|uniref:hypothetical protein n=1 Tax=Mesorhizobium sp. M0244 TaxID=2956926 RepID=UPI003339F18C
MSTVALAKTRWLADICELFRLHVIVIVVGVVIFIFPWLLGGALRLSRKPGSRGGDSAVGHDDAAVCYLRCSLP